MLNGLLGLAVAMLRERGDASEYGLRCLTHDYNWQLAYTSINELEELRVQQDSYLTHII